MLSTNAIYVNALEPLHFDVPLPFRLKPGAMKKANKKHITSPSIVRLHFSSLFVPSHPKSAPCSVVTSLILSIYPCTYCTPAAHALYVRMHACLCRRCRCRRHCAFCRQTLRRLLILRQSPSLPTPTHNTAAAWLWRASATALACWSCVKFARTLV